MVTSAKSTGSGEQVDQALVKAMSHPLRMRVFTILAQREASPSEIAAELDEPLGNVAYHVQVLNKLGCLELVKTTPVRGAVEHHYRAIKRPFFNDEDWARIPPALRTSITGTNLGDIWRMVRDALKAGKFEREDSHLSRTPLMLDEEGWNEMRDLLNGILDRAFEIEAESAGRLAKSGDDPPVNSTVVLMHFENPA